jgi:hypothetical protein
MFIMFINSTTNELTSSWIHVIQNVESLSVCNFKSIQLIRPLNDEWDTNVHLSRDLRNRHTIYNFIAEYNDKFEWSFYCFLFSKSRRHMCPVTENEAHVYNVIVNAMKQTTTRVRMLWLLCTNTHLKLVPRSRKCGSIHPLPHTP